jgi:hypothetical protein
MIDITINILYNMLNNLSINRKEALCFEKYIRKGGGKLIMAKRRGNGEGTIYKRQDGTWAGQVSIGYDPVTGKLKRKSFYGKTRKEVARQDGQGSTGSEKRDIMLSRRKLPSGNGLTSG